MNRTIQVVGGLGLAVGLTLGSTPAQAGGTAPTTTATAGRAFVAGAPCPGTTDPTDAVWDFSEAPGSTVFHANGLGAAYDLKVQPSRPGVTATGVGVSFADNGLLQTDGNVFNPGTSDFTTCAGVRIQENQYNLTQVNHSKQIPTVIGMVKLTGVYCQFIATNRDFKVWNTNAGNLNDGVNHTVTCVRHGEWFNMYVDGVSQGAIRQQGIGPITLDGRWEVGGKAGAVDGSDMFTGVIYWMRQGS